MVLSDNPLVRNVLRADIQLSERYKRCWTAHVRAAFAGLSQKDAYDQAVRDFVPIQLKDFIPDLRFRQQAVWHVAESTSPREADWKLPLCIIIGLLCLLARTLQAASALLICLSI